MSNFGAPNTLTRSLLLAAMVLLCSAIAKAEDVDDVLSGPDATPNVLATDDAEKPDILNVDIQNRFDAFKKTIKDNIGLNFGIDYNALGYVASSSLSKYNNGSGSLRFLGTWELFDRGGPNTGKLVFKVENRHSYGKVAPTAFNAEIGYAGLVSSVFSDQRWRTTHLYWQQNFFGGKGVAYAGFLDVTDYTDVYALASPWTGFSNLAFQTGSGTIGGLPDGAFGGMIGGFLTSNIYASASIADANADATDISKGFDTFFNDFETFKTVEIGWTSGARRLFIDNAHVTFWQIDERTGAATPDGYGVNFSVTKGINDRWLPFLRGGWAHNGGSLYEAALSIGLGYQRVPGRDLLGIGLNWSRPNENTFGTKLNDQFTLEVFQRLQVTEGLQVTPSIQVIKDPALNPNEEAIALFGMRARFAL
ncbi:carbohydrate porin [uncultured Roseibium sp.]|uniref:carbohydrate porin n=1 Tax=uncultured Roseibium sp. TaxID=1936171 RepID=UPI00261D2456|nr:carbohydrate porin [uncultured Roseibium sp.]